MLEGATMEMGKMYISLFIIVCMVSLTAFFINLNQANDFKQYVNYEIERCGGLTSTAMNEIDNYNIENYGGRFTVQSLSGTSQKAFGNEIDYTITGQYKFLFISIPDQMFNIKGSAISMVR